MLSWSGVATAALVVPAVPTGGSTEATVAGEERSSSEAAVVAITVACDYNNGSKCYYRWRKRVRSPEHHVKTPAAYLRSGPVRPIAKR